MGLQVLLKSVSLAPLAVLLDGKTMFRSIRFRRTRVAHCMSAEPSDPGDRLGREPEERSFFAVFLDEDAPQTRITGHDQAIRGEGRPGLVERIGPGIEDGHPTRR